MIDQADRALATLEAIAGASARRRRRVPARRRAALALEAYWPDYYRVRRERREAAAELARYLAGPQQ